MPQSLLMVAKAASTPIKRGVQVPDSQRIKPLSIGNFTYRQRPKVLIHNGLIPTTAAGRRAEKLEPMTAAARRAEKHTPACYLGQAPLTDTATVAATTETATSAERTDASESSP